MKAQRFQSLPKKTQPTLHSTIKQSNTDDHKFSIITNTQCPQTSFFQLSKKHDDRKSREKLYIHNIDIDYGRLEKPNHYYFDGIQYKKAMKMKEVYLQEQVPEGHMQTKRVTGISSLIEQSQLSEKNTEKKRLSEVNTETYIHKIQKTRLQTAQNMLSANNSAPKPKIKLQEVKAYEEVQRNQSNRKKLHSRIVKMFVAGGSKKTKIISYPDKSDYQQL